MKIDLIDLTVGDLVDGYFDDGEGGVRGYGDQLDIRPPFQREFIYGTKERDAVIDSILKGFPLNVMYWSDRGAGTIDKPRYEIIDGQQRTISIAQYVAEKPGFSFMGLGFDNQQSDIREKILSYKLMVYVCSGTDSEKLNWFKTINIAGIRLTNQELRNAVYAGSWVTDAKRYFSRNNSAAAGMGGDYLSGSAIRQEYLETAIKWISGNNIEEYMRRRQHEESAEPLWDYFREVIEWIEATFTNRDKSRRKLMKGQDWGKLHADFKDTSLDPGKIEVEIGKLILDDEVEKKSGIYPYILTGDETKLSLRAFKVGMKHKVYAKQAGICNICKEHFEIDEMEADHITPWREGGKTVEENCQMLCRKCNREKSSK